MSTLHFFASLFGYMGALLLFVQVLFGSRHIFSFFTKDTVFMNRIHKQIGIYGTLLVFMHPLLEMLWREDSIKWIFVPDFSFDIETSVSFGRIALYFLLIVWVTSAILRSKMKWRPWKYLHLLSYPIVFLTFIHVIHLGSLFEDYLFIRVLWFGFFALFVSSLLFRLVAFSGITKHTIKVIEKKMQGESILLLTVSAPQMLPFPHIGQHMYLQIKSFGSEHPFTVMDVNEKEGTITFGMRLGGKFPTQISELQEGSSLLVDGPYGTFTREAWNMKERVVIAGGVGVTPFVRLAKEYGKNLQFLYCNRSVDDAVERESIKSSVSFYRDIVDVYEGEDKSILVGRLDAELLSKTLEGNFSKKIYFICGSPFFIKNMRAIILSLGVLKENIYFEELGF